MPSRFSIFRRLALASLATVCFETLPLANAQAVRQQYPPGYAQLVESAVRSFQARDFDTALKQIDKADLLFPANAFSLNVRGAVAIERKQYEEGRRLCEEALKKDPEFFPAQFNLAEIPFVQGKHAEARGMFEALLEKHPKNELLQYRIFLTYLLEKNEDAARQALEKIPFPSNTASYYYAHAAWEFAHGNEKEARKWIQSGDWVFSRNQNSEFRDVLYDLGWLKRENEQPAAQ